MKFKQLIFLIILTSNSASKLFGSAAVGKILQHLKKTAGGVTEFLTDIAINTIAQAYQNRIASVCPEDVDPDILKTFVLSEFMKSVSGKKLKEVMGDDKKDLSEITSDFGRDLQQAAQAGARKLQNEILALDVPAFSLKPSTLYVSAIQDIKKQNSKGVCNDELLCFATHLFAAIPYNQRQHFSNEELKKRAIIQIYQEFLDFFYQAESGSKPEQMIEKMPVFLSVLQYFLEKNKFNNFYQVTVTKSMVDFQVNTKIVEKMIPEIFDMYNRLQLQPRLKLWKAEHDKTLLSQVESQRKLQEHFDRQVAEWNEVYDSLRQNWNIEQERAFQAIASEKLNFEIQLTEYEEALKKIEKLTEYLEKEKLGHFLLMQELEDKRLELLANAAITFADEQTKKLLNNQSGCWNQIKKDFEHGAAGLAVVKRCEHGMWNTFKKYLRESQDLLQNGEERKARALLKEKERRVTGLLNKNNNQSRIALWSVWLEFAKKQKIEKEKVRLIQQQQEFENNCKYMDNCIPEIRQIIQEEDQARKALNQEEKYDKIDAQIREKKRTSLAVLWRFMLENLKKLRMSKEEIKNIKKTQLLDKLLEIQFRQDSEEISPILPLLPGQKTAKLSLNRPTDVLEDFRGREFAVQTEPRMKNVGVQAERVHIRINDPYAMQVELPMQERLQPSWQHVESTEQYPEQEDGGSQNSDGSGDPYNPWSQDEFGNWYHDGCPVYQNSYGKWLYLNSLDPNPNGY